MNRPAILLIGAGGHARACIDVIEQQDVYRIAGLVGTPEQINTRQLGYTVLASDESLEQLAKSYQYALICVGQIESSQRRQRLSRGLLVGPCLGGSRHHSDARIHCQCGCQGGK